MSGIQGIGGQSDILAAAFSGKPKETEEEENTQGAQASGASLQKVPPAGPSGDGGQDQPSDEGSFMDSSSIDAQV